MKLRSHLLLLTIIVLLPMVGFGIGVALLAVDREQESFERGATERARALITAVDAELAGHVRLLRALANSLYLDSGDLERFQVVAARLLATQADWRDITLGLPSGQIVLSATHPLDAALAPIGDRASFDLTVNEQKPVIGNLQKTGDGYAFTVRVPVPASGAPRYVLTARIDPRAVLSLLTPQRLPQDWVGVVLDARDHIVARTQSHAETVGQPASDSLRAALLQSQEGWFHGATLEQADVYTPYSRSRSSGWTVAMGIPAQVIESGAATTLSLLTVAIVAAITSALLLAGLLSRRISAPIASLATTARALGRGSVQVPDTNSIDEVREVSQALLDAGKAVAEREDALRAADQAKDEFLAMLGHELRNPLGALASAVQVLQMVGSKEQASDKATAILARQIQHMTRLVDDLLDASRATTGKINLSKTLINLTEVIGNTVASLRASGVLDAHEVILETSPAWIHGDEARIEQIVSNLLGNAAKFTPAGGRITVRVFTRGDEAMIEVADSGVGMPPDLVPRVFDLFVQGESTIDRNLGGLGIGLTLVKRLTELHRGRVSVSSDGSGRGATFSVVLPAAHPPGDRTEPLTDATAARRSRRVLLIEDNDDVRQTLSAALGICGHRVVEASDGGSGIAAAARSHPEVAIVDIGLPGLDGYEVARRLRSMPGGETLLLIALTGYGQLETRAKAVEAGFDEFFTKPVSPERLANAIDSATRDGVATRRATTAVEHPDADGPTVGRRGSTPQRR